MTITGPDARSAAPGQAVADAAMLLLERMGLTPADLLAGPAARPPAPTFAEYIPVVSALVSDGCRKAYGSYWNRDLRIPLTATLEVSRLATSHSWPGGVRRGCRTAWTVPGGSNARES